jgi:hypothetical protein
MGRIYAQLSESGVCVGISQLSGEVIASNYVLIPSFDKTYLRQVYRDGQWTGERVEFSPAEVSEIPTSPKRILTRYEFRSLFTKAEQVAITAAKKTDVIIEVFMDSAENPTIDLDFPDVAEGLDYLISQNLIPAEKKEQIINGDYGPA